MEGVRDQSHIASALDGGGHIALLLGGEARTAAGFDFHIPSHIPADHSDIFVIDVVQLVARETEIARGQSARTTTANAGRCFF